MIGTSTRSSAISICSPSEPKGLVLLSANTDKRHRSGLSRLLHIVREYKLPSDEDAVPSEQKKNMRNREDAAKDIDSALEATRDYSIRAHVLASAFYLQLKDYELVADIAQAGLSLVKTIEAQIGLRMPG